MSRLIDADAIIQAVCTKLGIKDKKFLLPSEKAIVDVILNAPTIEARPKGKWIEARHYPGYECSVCHYGVQPWNNTNYCPNCGADMR